MGPGTAPLIIIIVAMLMVTAIITTWIQTRADPRVKAPPSKEDRAEGLVDENVRLRDQVERLENRIEVLERIATDPAERTAREIETLR